MASSSSSSASPSPFASGGGADGYENESTTSSSNSDMEIAELQERVANLEYELGMMERRLQGKLAVASKLAENLDRQRGELIEDCVQASCQLLVKSVELDAESVKLSEARAQLELQTNRYKRLREDCDEAEQHAREAEGEAEDLEREAEQTRVELQLSRARVAKLQDELSLERISNADLMDALQEATQRIGELEAHNRELDQREAQREPTFKRGKLMRTMCNGPRTPDEVGDTECYIEEMATTLVMEPTEFCCKPRPPLRSLVKRSISDAQIAHVILAMHTPGSTIILQFRFDTHMWRDCIVLGPASNGLSNCLSAVPRHNLHGEPTASVMNVPVTMLRFRDLDDEDDFHAAVAGIKKVLRGPSSAPIAPTAGGGGGVGVVHDEGKTLTDENLLCNEGDA